MSAPTILINLTRGDSASREIQLIREGVDYTPPESTSLLFTMKRNKSDPDNRALVQKVTGAGVSVIGTKATVVFIHEDTRDVDARTYVFDVQAVEPSATYTVAQGDVVVIGDVTRFRDTSVPIITTEPTAIQSAAESAAAAEAARAAAVVAKDLAEAAAATTAADRVQTGLDRVATAADRVQTAADRVQTGLDRTAVAADKATVATNTATASAAATTATTQAGIATTQAGVATTQAGLAATSASQAQTARTQANGSAVAASDSASEAGQAMTDAQTAQAAAEVAQAAAATSATAAAGSAAGAAESETNAATSETNSANSATAAATSETNAATSASAAATSEANAATSETNAGNSANAAATSETNAGNSASAAATSEANAANSASAAATSEANANTSASNAANSETNAASSAANASSSEANASNSANAAATSESNASNSASNAANSESNAAISESNAASSAAASEVSRVASGVSAAASQVSRLAAGASETAAGVSAASASVSAVSALNSALPLFSRYADAGSVGTAETDLYSDNIPVSAMSADGVQIIARYGLSLVNSAATKRVRVYFGGTQIYDSSALTMSATGSVDVMVTLIRASSSSFRAEVSAAVTGGATATATTYTSVTGLTLTSVQILKITGTSTGVTAANNDIVARLARGYVGNDGGSTLGSIQARTVGVDQLISDGVTSNRGQIYTPGTRGNYAGAANIELVFTNVLVPTSISTAELYGARASATATAISQTFSLSVAFSTNDLVVRANGAATTDNRIWTVAGFRTNYSGQTIGFLRIAFAAGTSDPVLMLNGSPITGATTTNGTPPDWLVSTLVLTNHVVAYNYALGLSPICTEVIGSLTSDEATAWRTTGKPPLWVALGGSAEAMITGDDSTFASDTGFWTKLISAAISVGQCSLPTSGGSSIFRDTILVANSRYALSLTVISGGVKLGYAVTPDLTIGTGAGTYTLLFTTGSGTIPARLGIIATANSTVIDDVRLVRLGALSLPRVQCIPVLDDVTAIGGNPARLVGMVGITDDRFWRISADTTTSGNQQILGVAVLDSTVDVIDTAEQTTTGTPTTTIGSASGGSQYKASSALSAGINPVTLVTRKLASNNLWVNANSTATVRTTITGHRTN